MSLTDPLRTLETPILTVDYEMEYPKPKAPLQARSPTDLDANRTVIISSLQAKMPKRSFLTNVKKLTISEIANHWGKEIGVESSIIERKLIDYISTKSTGSFRAGEILEFIGPVKNTVLITTEELEEYCNEKGLDFPRFWSRSVGETSRVSSAKAENDCSRWLTVLSDGPKNRSKDKYFDEAEKKFPRLLRRGFDRAWEKSVPRAWKDAGRIKKANKIK